jgi:hypothetical protein
MKLPKCANEKCAKRVKDWRLTYCNIGCYRKSRMFKDISRRVITKKL